MIYTIPQYKDTCWFNSILTTSLYSQLSRRMVMNKIGEWDKADKELMLIKKIILKYYKIDKETGDKFFYKIKPETIILKIAERFENKSLFNYLIKDIYLNKYEWYSHFIIDFYKFLGIKCMDIYYISSLDIYLYNTHKYYNYEKDKFGKIEKQELNREIPDVLIIGRLNNMNLSKKQINLFKSSRPIIDDELLILNGNVYKLDSILMKNESKFHAIAGITYKYEKYIYNSYPPPNKDKIKSACDLVKYDWNIHNPNDYFYYEDCELKDFPDDDKNNIYSPYFDNKTILIYIRINKDLSLSSNSKKDISIGSKEFEEDIPQLINKFYKINEKDENDIKEKMKLFDISYDISKSFEENKQILFKNILDLYI